MKKLSYKIALWACLICTQSFSQICSPVSSGNNDNLDWENTPSFTFYLSSNNGAPSYISNPFFASGTTCNENIFPFCNNISPYNDISSSDGWRFVTKDFGQPTNTIECPVFVLYNIYSGMLRVFFYKSLTTPGNSGVVDLQYLEGSKRTAMLENYGGSVKNAIEKFNNHVNPILVPNSYVLSPSWSHADFLTQYDPCTCQSKSTYTFKLISTLTSNISFTINGQVKQEIKANQAGSEGLTVKSAASGLSAVGDVFGIFNGQKPDEYANVFNDLSDVFLGIGKVVTLADFFFGLFKKEVPAKVTPLVFNVNLSGSGSINTDNPLQKLPFNNPGSDLSTVPTANRPVFNNIMGTFSLLTTPEITLNNHTTHYYGSYYDPDYNLNCEEELGVNTTQLEIQPIKWVLNPSAQLSVDKLQASYIINFWSGRKEVTPNYPLGCFLSYKPHLLVGQSYNSNCSPSRPSDYITSIELKITGNFTAGNNQKLVFTNLYATNLNGLYSEDETNDEFPPVGCSTITPSASYSEIENVCNSYSYTSRRDQFYVAPTDDDKNVRTNGKTKNDAEMLISPNPASGTAELQYSIKEDGKVHIALYDLVGKMIKQVENTEGAKAGYYNLQINLADVPSGMYMVVLNLNGKTVTKKLSVLQK